MKLFLDTADVKQIRLWSATGLIDGVTTNPTNMSAQASAPLEIIKELSSLLPDGLISVEVTEQEPQAVYEQAVRIAALAENIVVKIPCAVQYYAIINKLVQQEIPLNITLVFSVAQAVMMAKLGVDMVSPFVGRLDDSGVDGIQVLSDICTVYELYSYDTAVLAASIRSVQKFEQALMAGADAVTIPIQVLEGLTQHTLTDKGMLTFNQDWQKLGIRQFP